jgi:hypothetical protein
MLVALLKPVSALIDRIGRLTNSRVACSKVREAQTTYKDKEVGANSSN